MTPPRPRASTPKQPPPRTLAALVAAGDAGIILDEQILYRIAVRKNLVDTLFPPRPALDAAAVERLLKEGVLTSADILPAVFVKGPVPQ